MWPVRLADSDPAAALRLVHCRTAGRGPPSGCRLGRSRRLGRSHRLGRLVIIRTLGPAPRAAPGRNECWSSECLSDWRLSFTPHTSVPNSQALPACHLRGSLLHTHHPSSLFTPVPPPHARRLSHTLFLVPAALPGHTRVLPHHAPRRRAPPRPAPSLTAWLDPSELTRPHAGAPTSSLAAPTVSTFQLELQGTGLTDPVLEPAYGPVVRVLISPVASECALCAGVRLRCLRCLSPSRRRQQCARPLDRRSGAAGCGGPPAVAAAQLRRPSCGGPVAAAQLRRPGCGGPVATATSES